MLKWLLNFKEINEDFPDVSDYNIFAFESIKYIKQHNEEHTRLKGIFISSLTSLKNASLISITYLFLSHIECGIDFQIKSEHLEDPLIRDNALLFISQNYNILYKQSIMESLFDRNYFSDGLISVLRVKDIQIELIRFLNLKDPLLLIKQVRIMINLKIYINLEYFLTFIGSNTKEYCFAAFELLAFLVDENIKNDLYFIHNASVDFKKPFWVESVDNFIFYFIDFFPNKEIVCEMYYMKNLQYFKNLLDKYIKNECKINFNYKKLYFRCIKSWNDVFEDYEIDFNYLFEGKHYKVKTDCIEI